LASPPPIWSTVSPRTLLPGNRLVAAFHRTRKGMQPRTSPRPSGTAAPPPDDQAGRGSAIARISIHPWLSTGRGASAYQGDGRRRTSSRSLRPAGSASCRGFSFLRPPTMGLSAPLGLRAPSPLNLLARGAPRRFLLHLYRAAAGVEGDDGGPDPRDSTKPFWEVDYRRESGRPPARCRSSSGTSTPRRGRRFWSLRRRGAVRGRKSAARFGPQLRGRFPRRQGFACSNRLRRELEGLMD